MKAVVFKGPRELTVENVPDPVAGPHEVLVKVKDSGICGSDLHFYTSGLLPPGSIMGHEATGTVASVGSAVTGWKEGDQVWVSPYTACGQCSACLDGNPDACENFLVIGIGVLPGAFAEYIKVPATMLVPLPDNVGMREGTLVDPLGCAHYAAELSGIAPGQSALVMGAGPIGLFLVQYLDSLGMGPVILSEPVAGRAALGKEFGADFVINPFEVGIEEACRKLTGGVGPEIVFECVGIPETVHDSVMLVRNKGKVVWVGVCMEQVTFLPSFWGLKKISIHFSLGMGEEPDDSERHLEFIQDKHADVGKVITELISIEEVPDAFERLLKPNDEVKILIEF